MILSAIIVLLAAIGVFFTFVAAVGVLRLPDVYSRSHAVTKADTLGVGCSIFAVALYFGTASESFRAIVLLLFVYYTNPTAAHAITRSAYSRGVEVWTADTEEDTQ